MDYVKCHVPEIPLVAHPIAAADAGFAVAENIVRKTDAWRDGAIVRIPEPTHRAVRSELHRAVAHPVVVCGSCAVVKIGIQTLIVVVLHAKVFLAEAVIEGEARRDPETILQVYTPVLVAITVREARGTLIDVV